MVNPLFRSVGLWILFLTACGAESTSGPSAEARIVEAGFSFGFCLGPCRGELAIVGTALFHTISDRTGEETLARNGGELTTTGAARLQALASALPETLMDTYGCPDCADGGAAYFIIERESGSQRVEYEYGTPPAELAELDAFLKAAMASLTSCETTADTRPASGCTPFTP